MTVVRSEPTRATALDVPGGQPLRRLNLMRVGYAVMDIGAQELWGPPDVVRSVEADLPEIGPGDVLEHGIARPSARTIRPSSAALPPSRALRGDPWRPRV